MRNNVRNKRCFYICIVCIDQQNKKNRNIEIMLEESKINKHLYVMRIHTYHDQYPLLLTELVGSWQKVGKEKKKVGKKKTKFTDRIVIFNNMVSFWCGLLPKSSLSDNSISIQKTLNSQPWVGYDKVMNVLSVDNQQNTEDFLIG